MNVNPYILLGAKQLMDRCLFFFSKNKGWYHFLWWNLVYLECANFLFLSVISFLTYQRSIETWQMGSTHAQGKEKDLLDM